MDEKFVPKTRGLLDFRDACAKNLFLKHSRRMCEKYLPKTLGLLSLRDACREKSFLKQVDFWVCATHVVKNHAVKHVSFVAAVHWRGSGGKF